MSPGSIRPGLGLNLILKEGQMSFFPPEALSHHRKHNPNSLDNIIVQFPIKLKKALYAVAEKGDIKARTWNGCALNQAGLEYNKTVHASQQAARAFNISETLVNRFIRRWDSFLMSSPNRAKLLKETLIRIGITVPPEQYSTRSEGTVVFDFTPFKSLQTRFIEELDDVKTINDIPGMSFSEISAASTMFFAGEHNDNLALPVRSS